MRYAEVCSLKLHLSCCGVSSGLKEDLLDSRIYLVNARILTRPQCHSDRGRQLIHEFLKPGHLRLALRLFIFLELCAVLRSYGEFVRRKCWIFEIFPECYRYQII